MKKSFEFSVKTVTNTMSSKEDGTRVPRVRGHCNADGCILIDGLVSSNFLGIRTKDNAKLYLDQF